MTDHSAVLPAAPQALTRTETPFAPDRHQPPQRLQFTGAGGEYFRIWIVNLLLTVVTLGIYSAWAKVRRERWFLRNTCLEDSPFDYHGQPLAILKGRAVVVLGLLVLNGIGKISPLLSVITSLALFFALPWIITRALRFRALNTSWRGLRFRFCGSVRGAVQVFVLWPMLIVFTLGLIVPYVLVKRKEYVFNNLRYGDAAFSLRLPAGKVYGIYLRASLLPLLGVVGLLAFFAMKLPAVGVVLLWASILAVLPFVLACTANLIWANAALGLHRFESDQKVGELYAIWFKNILLSLLTLGLYRPFAAVNLWRYRVERLSVLPAASLASFVAGQREEVRILGEEASDLMDVDLGI